MCDTCGGDGVMQRFENPGPTTPCPDCYESDTEMRDRIATHEAERIAEQRWQDEQDALYEFEMMMERTAMEEAERMARGEPDPVDVCDCGNVMNAGSRGCHTCIREGYK